MMFTSPAVRESMVPLAPDVAPVITSPATKSISVNRTYRIGLVVSRIIAVAPEVSPETVSLGSNAPDIPETTAAGATASVEASNES